jgi:hypothetical protein
MATAEITRSMNEANERDPHNNNCYGTLVDRPYLEVKLPVLDVQDFNERVIRGYEDGSGPGELPADTCPRRATVSMTVESRPLRGPFHGAASSIGATRARRRASETDPPAARVSVRDDGTAKLYTSGTDHPKLYPPQEPRTTVLGIDPVGAGKIDG